MYIYISYNIIYIYIYSPNVLTKPIHYISIHISIIFPVYSHDIPFEIRSCVG